MKKFFVAIVAVLAFAVAANANNYTVDDSAIDALVENAIDVTPMLATTVASLPAALPASSGAKVSVDNKAIGAWLLCTFLGGFGVHRHYLGTRPAMWAIYTFTIGGIFGIVPFVDWVMLLVGIVEDDITKYVGNTKFIMW